MFKIIFFAVACLVICAGFAYAQDVVAEFEGRYWVADLDKSEIRVSESGLGTDFDLKSDLGVDDEDFPEGRFTWHTGPNSRLRIGYTQAKYKGSQNISRTVEFRGQTYTAGTHVESELKLQYLRAGWIWQFINLMDKVKLGPILELKGVMGDVSLRAPYTAPVVDESKDFLGGLPTVGIALDINPVEKINFFAEISGLGAGNYGHFFDAEAGLKLIPIKNFSLFAGYRIVDIKVDYKDYLGKIRLTGPFAGATLRF